MQHAHCVKNVSAITRNQVHSDVYQVQKMSKVHEEAN